MLLLIGAIGVALAAAPRDQAFAPRFVRLVADGLSHNSVYAITQDREGFLWFGTADGLNRFDGHAYRIYRHDPQNPASISHNLVRALHPDRAGGLWVATADGLNRLDPRTDRFQRFALRSETTGLEARVILVVHEGPEGTLWIGTDAGLFRGDSLGARFVEVSAAWPAHVARGVHGIREDRAGHLWILAGRRGAWHLGRRAPDDRVEWLALSPAWGDLLFNTLLLDTIDRVWLSGDGPAVLDRSAGLVHPPRHGGPPAAAWAGLLAPDGARWIGTSDGLYHSSPGADRGVRHPVEAARQGFLFNFVRALFQDRSGTLWVGTHGGIYRADPHAKPFHHVPGEPGNPEGLSDGAVSAVLAAGPSVWIGTFGAGLNQLDRASGRVRRFRHAPNTGTSLPDDVVHALERGADGTFWVATGRGLSRFDRERGRFRLVATGAAQPGARSAITSIVKDASGALWLTGGRTLRRYDPGAGSTDQFDLPGGPPHALTESALLVGDSILWLGMHPGELVRFDLRTRQFRRTVLRTSNGRRLVTEAVWSLQLDRQGALWLGTGDGLLRFDPAGESFRHFTERDGLPGSVVTGLLPDREGRLWVATNHGLARFDPAADTVRFRNFDAADGVGNTEFNRHAAHRGEDGTLYFGGMEGLSYFTPEAIRESPVVPPVVLTRVETASRAGVRPHNPRGLDRLTLSYRDYSLAFEFAALDYTNPARNRYAHRLDGLEREWVESGTRRFARYTNLPPGAYTLRVRGTNHDGAWSSAEAVLAIRILPPFWQTGPFRGLGVLTLGLLGWAWYRARVARLVALERLRLRIAGDLHDDLSSNLVAIALQGEKLQQATELGVDERRQLARVSATARRMVQDLRDIVWLVDPSRDQFDDLVLKLKDLATTLLPDVVCEVTVHPPGRSGRIALGIRRQVVLIGKEVLTNIARHAGATRVTIEVTREHGTLHVTITDDGRGFAPDRSDAPGFGLRNLRRRAEDVGGEIRITSRPGAGTRVALRLPVP